MGMNRERVFWVFFFFKFLRKRNLLTVSHVTERTKTKTKQCHLNVAMRDLLDRNKA